MNEIRDARKAAGLTQAGMSETMGIPKRTIEDWEAGKASPPEWAKRLVLKELAEIAENKNLPE